MAQKTPQTEWDQRHDPRSHRFAALGQTAADVVNARNQFSDINGLISRRYGRDEVAQLPASVISHRVHQVTDQYLAARAAGRG